MPEQLGRPRLFDWRTFPISGVGRTFLYDEVKACHLVVTEAGRCSIVLHDGALHWLAKQPKLATSTSGLARAFDVTNKPTNDKGGTGAALPRFFTIGDVANFLEVSSRTVRRWIKTGALRVHRFGSAVRISEADVLAFIATHREG